MKRLDTKKPSAEQLKIYRDFLKRFLEFGDEEWMIFSKELYVKLLKKKEFFTEAGKVCDEVGFILEGSVRFYYSKDGEEITNYFCLENEMISSYKSFLTGNPGIMFIEALENSTLILFSKTGLEKLIADTRINYKIERFGRLVAEYYLICYDDRVAGFITKSPEERYLQLLKDQRHVVKRIPQHYIANYLGITPVSLSRIRRRMMGSLKKEKTA